MKELVAGRHQFGYLVCHIFRGRVLGGRLCASTPTGSAAVTLRRDGGLGRRVLGHDHAIPLMVALAPIVPSCRPAVVPVPEGTMQMGNSC